MKNFLVLSFLILLAAASASAQTTIAAARLMAAGTTVTVSGTVTSGNELGTIRYIQDTTAGIAVYGSSLGNTQPGQIITVSGTLKNYYNLLEISPVNSFVVNSSGNPLPDPLVVTPSQLAENVESQLVRINNLTFDAGQGSTFSSGTYKFHAGGQQGVVYIRTGHPLIGYSIPAGTVSLVGICSQYQNEYQLLLRGSSDIIGGGLSMTVQPHAENISTSGFTVSWATDKASTTEIFYGNTPQLELGKISLAGTSVNHSVNITGAQPSQLFYIKAFSVSGTDTAFAAVKAFITQSLSAGWIRVYFTSNVDVTYASVVPAVSLGTKVEDTLIAYINKAKYTIDMAMYNFTLSRIPNALNQAVQRGVRVRIVYNSNTSNTSLQSVPSIPKIASPDGSSYGIMHNKFFVIDAGSADAGDAVVWTGSTNLTSQQLSSDANNVVIINDQSLAKAYTIEFEEMWGSHTGSPSASNALFGPDKTDNTPHEFIIGGNRVECYFSPSDGVNSRIIEAINSASTDVNAAVYIITRTDIANAIQDRVNAGAEVNVIIDSESDLSSYPSVGAVLLGLGSHFTSDKYTTGLEHNKYVIIDRKNSSSDPFVLTGTHNWSTSAETRNDENTLVIHDPNIVNLYFQEFASRFKANGGTLALKELARSTLELQCYPNPSANFVTIETKEAGVFITEIQVYDITGKLEQTETFTGNQATADLSLSRLPAGVYLMKVMTTRGSSMVKLIRTN